MLLIDCPHCGPRDEVEFHYGGQAHIAYPEDPQALSDREWAEYLFYRDNPRGPFAERWQHSVGCRKWFNAVRDTATYEFLAIYPMGEPAPDLVSLAAARGSAAGAQPSGAGSSAAAPHQPAPLGSDNA